MYIYGSWMFRERDLELENSKSFPVEENMIRATSASQRTESSSAFLKSPLLLLEKVTCLAVALSIFLIWIFSLAISAPSEHNYDQKKLEKKKKSHQARNKPAYNLTNQPKWEKRQKHFLYRDCVWWKQWIERDSYWTKTAAFFQI